MTGRWRVRPADRPAGRQVPPYPGGVSRHQPKPPSGRLWRDLIIATRPAHQPLPSLLSAAAAQGLFRAPARAFLLSPTAPFLPTAEEMGERTPAETAFLHFLSALCLFTATRAFPHATGVFLIVVVPPTVPAQLSAAAARCYGKLFCSLVLRDNKHITPRARRAHLPIAVLRAAMGAI